MRSDLPSGTVTFLFTDIASSTRLLHELGTDGYAEALAEHRRVLRAAFTAHGGVEVDTQGDAFFYAFAHAADAVAAARAGQQTLREGPIQVRIGLHTGEARVTGEGYVGAEVHRGARIAASAHGGQVVLSRETRSQLDAEPELLDLGEHRLKDFSKPVWLYQLGEERFPPLRTISNTNLPRPASSFVGREKEVGELRSLLQDGTRLLTLTGPGGSGKTRLAIEAASELVPEFKAGVFWVDLAPLRDAALVSDVVKQTLGANRDLAEHIGERELLLLLDNLEQVVDAAIELASLVESCPNLRLLVTSRELLRVKGEVEYPVLPLAEAEAVDLFCTRARAEPSRTVHELCRALDNLPLALELAAGRASSLSTEQILERLSHGPDLLKGGRDSDPRQQTLQATMDWSHGLLEPLEQQLFARLAVFRGGCTLDTAEEVADAELDTLQTLVDKNLLRRADDRFSMLETIRRYAARRLEESGEAGELRHRHAEHFLELAEKAEPNLLVYSREWLDQLEREHDNLRAALDRLAASGESELVLRLAGALSRFWDEKGHLAEGRRRLEGALRVDERPTATRAKALNGASDMAVSLGDARTARLWAEKALALNRTLGDAWATAESGFLLGLAVADEGDLARARQLFDESAGRFAELGDHQYALVASRMLAWMCYRLGDRERGRALHEDNLTRARELQNEHVEASTLGALAMIALDDARFDDAVSMLKESHRVHRDLGDPHGVARGLCRAARVLASIGRAEPAARLLAASEVLHEELGAGVRPWLAEMNEQTLSTIRASLDEASFAEAWHVGRALTADQALALVLDALS